MEAFIFVVAMFAVVFGLVYFGDHIKKIRLYNNKRYKLKFADTYCVYGKDNEMYCTAVIDDEQENEVSENKYGKLLMRGWYHGTADVCEMSINLNTPADRIIGKVVVDGFEYEVFRCNGEIAKALNSKAEIARLNVLKEMNKRC